MCARYTDKTREHFCLCFTMMIYLDTSLFQEVFYMLFYPCCGCMKAYRGISFYRIVIRWKTDYNSICGKTKISSRFTDHLVKCTTFSWGQGLMCKWMTLRCINDIKGHNWETMYTDSYQLHPCRLWYWCRSLAHRVVCTIWDSCILMHEGINNSIRLLITRCLLCNQFPVRWGDKLKEKYDNWCFPHRETGELLTESLNIIQK